MARINMTFSARQAVRLGVGNTNPIDVSDTTTLEDREIIARNLEYDAEIVADEHIVDAVAAGGCTAEAVAAGLRAKQTAKTEATARQEAQDARRKAEQMAKWAKDIDDRRGRPDFDGITDPGAFKPYGCDQASLPAGAQHDLKQWEADVAVERAALEARRETVKAERAAAEEAATEERATWIVAHGSDRLKRCVAEKFEHTAIYRDERLAIERPGWQWGEYAGVDAIRNPSKEALAQLDASRVTDPEAELVWMSWYRVGDPDEENVDSDGEVKCHRAAVHGDFLGRVIEFTG